MLLTARQEGIAGNSIPITPSNVSSITVDVPFKNGLDQQSQSLSFPRAGLVDRNGLRIIGVPHDVMQAAAEYSIRAAASPLFADPVVDDTGRIVIEKSEKVGPLEETTKYAEGGSVDQLIKPYPAADRLMKQYLTSAGGTTR